MQKTSPKVGWFFCAEIFKKVFRINEECKIN